MASVDPGMYRPGLIERRERLQHALSETPGVADLDRLLGEVDAALDRLESGSFGLCETCHDPIEPELLGLDPLVRFCLADLSEHERHDLEQDLQVAGRIQRGMLPGQALIVGPWEIYLHFAPAGPVSGDFCDVVSPPGSDGMLAILGDVSGKGVSAALLSAHLHAIFRSLADDKGPVAELVGRANRVFRHGSPTPHFATLVCLRAGGSGSLEVCNAGHCPPLVVSANGVRSLEPTGLPVGTFLSSHYTSHTLDLAAGDVVVLYTDGLTEARDATGMEYASERLEAHLASLGARAPREVVTSCLQDLARHLGGESLQDDLTLLALRRRG
jgi:phosphoserine phosphatase RsbU/P